MTAVAETTVAEDPAAADLDDLDHDARRRHTLVWLGGLSLLLVVTIPLAIGIGPVPIDPGTVAKIVGHHAVGWPGEVTWTSAEDSIVQLVRLPRVLLGAVVGAGLSISGVVLQAMVRNVLADPYVLGVTSGASTGAAATILFGVGIGLGSGSLTASAFAGALIAMAAVFLLARVGGGVTSVRLLLAGVSVGYILAAATSFLIFASDSPEGARAVLFWLLGSLSFAQWSSVVIAAVVVVACASIMLLWSRRLDALAIGDDTARTLGVAPARVRAQMLIVVSLCVGAVVAVAGAIGFVGLVVPHVARLCVGGVHRRVIPVAALIGATFLVWADVFARIVFDPQELPLGIVTAVVGAPMLLVLVRRFYTSTV